MFQFESLELLYWDCWERFKVPLDERIITVTGPNGSGKTTLLDALRTLLAMKTSEKRDYKKYARRPNRPHSWVVSVVSNKRNSRNRRPFFPVSTEKVTLACHINKKGGDWQREYYILPGALSLEEIIDKTSEPSDIFYKPKKVSDYQVELEKAGFSHAMLTVLALEQGSTDKLCEYAPRELLNLVYAAFGDKPTLDNYEKAIHDQVEAEKELEVMRVRVEKLNNQCAALVNKVNNYREYERLISEKTRLATEVTAQARYVELSDNIEGAGRNILGLQKDKIELERIVSILSNDRDRVSTEESELKGKVESLKATLESVQVELIKENGRRAAIATKLDEIKTLREACKDVESETLEPLCSILEAAQREQFSVEHDLKKLGDALAELREENKSLLSNKLRLDRPIESFHQKLSKSGIAHSFLYENVEVLNERWRVAVESILKWFRYVILLKNPSDRWQAWKMGEEDGYRHFIVGESGNTSVDAPKGSALEVVRLSDEIPVWIRKLLSDIQLVESVEDGKRLPEGSTFVTAKGFSREKRGGRSIVIDGSDFAFGKMGRKKRLEALEKQISELEEQERRLNERLKEAVVKVTGLKGKIEKQEKLQRYLVRKVEEDILEEEHVALLQKIIDVELKQESFIKEKSIADEKRVIVGKQLKTIEMNLQQKNAELKSTRDHLFNQRRERCEKYKELRRLRTTMPDGWRTREVIEKYKEEFDGIKHVDREIAEIKRKLEDGQWEKDQTVLVLKDKVEKDYKGEKANLDKKETELSETRRVTDRAREAYIDYLRHSMRFYEKNLKTLAGLAGVDIEIVKPHLKNDDKELREAGLDVKWNFDNKGFTATDDGEGSGGQQVIKSLILLIALLMAEDDQGGFIFIDEPFAHLDVFNIDRVAEFLLATNTQYIITSPNTHNTNVYRPAFLTLVTRKKRPDQQFADPPGHLRRMDPAHA